MAYEIEIVSTKGNLTFSMGDFISLFREVNDNHFDGYFDPDLLSGIDYDGVKLDKTGFFPEKRSYGYFFGSIDVGRFAIDGPIHNLFDPEYTAVDLLDDNRRFSIDLLPSLGREITDVDTSFHIRWTSGSDLVKDNVAYVLSLVLAMYTEGVVVNNYGTRMPEGTYIWRDWLDLIKQNIVKRD